MYFILRWNWCQCKRNASLSFLSLVPIQEKCIPVFVFVVGANASIGMRTNVPWFYLLTTFAPIIAINAIIAIIAIFAIINCHWYLNNSLTSNTWRMAIIRHKPGRLKAAVKSKQLSSRRLYCHVKQRVHMEHWFDDTIWTKKHIFCDNCVFTKHESMCFHY